MEGFENLSLLLENCIEGLPKAPIFGKQALRLSSRLSLFKSAFVAILKNDNFTLGIEQVEKVQSLEKLLEKLFDMVDLKLSLPIVNWENIDEYKETPKNFQSVVTEIIKLDSELQLNMPLAFIVDNWQDAIDAQIDWATAMAELDSDDCDDVKRNRFEQLRPIGPCFKKIDWSEIIEVHNMMEEEMDNKRRIVIDDEDEDDNNKSGAASVLSLSSDLLNMPLSSKRPPFCSVHLGVASKAPVFLKKIRAELVRGGESSGGLLQLAHTHHHAPSSDSLHKAIAICTEAGRLKTLTQLREELNGEDGASSEAKAFESIAGVAGSAFAVVAGAAFTIASNVPLADRIGPDFIAIASPLAPLGSLADFLNNPPGELLVDEKSHTSLSRSAGGTLPPHILMTIVSDVCSGLTALHSKGIIHGRLHFNNVLIFQNCRAKLCDFGLSHILSPEAGAEASQIASGDEGTGGDARGRGLGIGWDARWRAPEDVLREESASNCLSDVYGLGLVMFSVFSGGRKPYFNLPWEEAVINTLRREEKPTLPGNVPFSNVLKPIVAEPDGIMHQCLEFHPYCRPRLANVEKTVKSLLSELMFQHESRLRDDLDSDIRIAEMKVESKAKKLSEGEKKSAKAHDILLKKEDEMNALKMASEKRKVKASLDKARPKLDALDADNTLLREELAADAKQISKLKSELAASEGKLVGGKNYMLRHLTRTDNYDMASLIKRYAHKKDINYLLKFCTPPNSLQSLIYKYGAPLGREDEIGEEELMELCGGSLFGRGSDSNRPDIVAIMYGNRTGANPKAVARPDSLFSGLTMSSNATESCAVPDEHVTKRRTSVVSFYKNDELMRVTTSEVGRERDMWDWAAMNNLGTAPPAPPNRRTSVAEEEYRTIPRHPPRTKALQDLSEVYSDYELQDEDYSDVVLDAPEVMLLAALRGDVREAVGIYNSQNAYDVKFIAEKVALWEGHFSPPANEKCSDWSSPCHLAAARGHLGVLKCLIEGSKQPADEVDRWGRTPFMVACLHGHLPIVRYLRESHKVDIESPDNDEVTPILMAATCGHCPIVKYLSKWLLHKGGRTHYEDGDSDIGGSILHWACLCGSSTVSRRYSADHTLDPRHLETLRFIIKDLKVPVDIRASSDNSTPLSWLCAVKPLSKTKQKMVEFLVQCGADLHAVDKSGHSILFGAAASGDVALVRILVEKYKVSLLVQDEDGTSVRDVATGLALDYLKLKMRGKRFSLFVK